MKNLESILKGRVAALIETAILLIVYYYIDNSNYSIFLKTLLKSALLLTIALLVVISFIITPCIRKKKIIKKYSELQIEILKKIFQKEIQSPNDFFLQYYKYDRQYIPFNSQDTNPNYFVSTEVSEANRLLKEFKELIIDLIEYKYIKLEIDKNIETFTYLKKSESPNAHYGIEIFHNLASGFQNEFKQKRFIINNKKLKRIICKKYLPEKFKEIRP